jgi:hypothetical protein
MRKLHLNNEQWIELTTAVNYAQSHLFPIANTKKRRLYIAPLLSFVERITKESNGDVTAVSWTMNSETNGIAVHLIRPKVKSCGVLFILDAEG